MRRRIRHAGSFALLIVVCLTSIAGVVSLVGRARSDGRADRFDALVARLVDEPARGFTAFETRRIPAPEFARGSLSLVAQSEATSDDVKFFEGVTEYRVYWHQLDNEAAARRARAAAVARAGWTLADLPIEIGERFYEDGACITRDRTRWQCLHGEDDTLIVGEALTADGMSETPFGPHHALQTGTKGWIAVRNEHAADRRQADLESAAIALLPWALWGGARWWRSLDESSGNRS